MAKHETGTIYLVVEPYGDSLQLVSATVRLTSRTVRYIDGDLKTLGYRHVAPRSEADFTPEDAVLRYQAQAEAEITRLRAKADALEANARAAAALLKGGAS